MRITTDKPSGPTIIVAAALLAHLALVTHRCWVKSPTLDEVAHLAAGLANVEFGRFDLYRVNPPLPRLPAGIALKLANTRMDWSEYEVGTVNRTEFDNGAMLAKLNASRYRTLVFWARIACLPWTIMGLLLCTVWAWRLHGPWAGAIAAVLWAFCPETIAHASMVTPDIAATACGLLAGLLLDRWLGHATWTAALWAGIALGIALLSKFSWILLVPLWPLLAGVWWFAFERFDWEVARRRLLQLTFAMGVALFVLNAGYGFEGTGSRLDEFTYWSNALGGPGASRESPNESRFEGTWPARVPIPIPKNVLLGIDVQKADFENGLPSYLAGRWSDHGWWYYYLYAAAVKLPLALLFLAFLAASRGGTTRHELTVIVPGVALFAFVSSQTGFSHHFRYVLPTLPFLFIYIGRLADPRLAIHSRIGRGVVGAAFAAFITATLTIHPHELSFFNVAAGGPRNGHAHLVDSNIDWGQDLWLLRDWLEEHRDGRPLGLVYFGGFSQPSWFGIDHSLPPVFRPGDDRENQPPRYGPQPGLYALSINFLRGRTEFRVPDGHDGFKYVSRRDWTYFLEHFEPIATAGYSIYIYDLSLEEVNHVRRSLGLSELPVPQAAEALGHRTGL